MIYFDLISSFFSSASTEAILIEASIKCMKLIRDFKIMIGAEIHKISLMHERFNIGTIEKGFIKMMTNNLTSIVTY